MCDVRLIQTGHPPYSSTRALCGSDEYDQDDGDDAEEHDGPNATSTLRLQKLSNLGGHKIHLAWRGGGEAKRRRGGEA